MFFFNQQLYNRKRIDTMKHNYLKNMGLLVVILISVISCAKDIVTFNVTKPSQLQIAEVESIAIGNFEDVIGEIIPLPEGVGKVKSKNTIRTFKSNKSLSEMVRAYVISEISKGGQYKIINSTGEETGFSGVIPNMAKVGVINARIKYYEHAKEDNDKKFFILLITNNGMPLEKRLIIAGLKAIAVKAAERSGKGFKIPVPYVERIGAVEVRFDLVRKSNGKKIIPTQTLRFYNIKKWGGDEDVSILAREIKKVILAKYDVDESILDVLTEEARKTALVMMDSDEFIAKGYHLKQNSNVPLLALDLKQTLASEVAKQFTRKISKYHVEEKIEIADGGDPIGISLMKGNAYDKAIGYLESLSKPLDLDNVYNLALSYESMGEYPQALNYYEQGRDASDGEERFKFGIKRVKR
jgi:tetratricopeptide (TPR) repeat protein